MNSTKFHVVYDIETDKYYCSGEDYIAGDTSPEYYVVSGVCYYSKSQLKRDGILDSHLSALQIKHDLHIRNPRYPSVKMYLYKMDKIDDAFKF